MTEANPKKAGELSLIPRALPIHRRLCELDIERRMLRRQLDLAIQAQQERERRAACQQQEGAANAS